MVRIGIPLKYSHLSDDRCILYLSERVRRTIQKAGGFVVPIVQVQDVNYCDTKWNEFLELTDYEKEMIDNSLDLVDGVLFPGGHKVTPFDQFLLKRCIERNIPTLGICLGMQLMSSYKKDFKVFLNNSSINHFQDNDIELTHKVRIQKESLLYQILKKDEIDVNSFHRYHIKNNSSYSISAISEDGYIEGIELKNQTFHLGIQWHPEISYEFDDNSKKIIDFFINICNK